MNINDHIEQAFRIAKMQFEAEIEKRNDSTNLHDNKKRKTIDVKSRNKRREIGGCWSCFTISNKNE